MSAPAVGWTVLVDEPRFVTVWAAQDSVRVYVSPVVRDDDRVFAQLRSLLAGRCHTLDRVTVADDLMMFGEAEQRTYKLLPFCPGKLSHECAVTALNDLFSYEEE